MKFSEKKKIALVLSGGGIKAAAFHIGVCLALKEKGFRFAGGSKEEVLAKHSDKPLTIQFYVGSSAGSVISTFLAAGFSLSSIICAFERGTRHLSESLDQDVDESEPLRPISYRDIFSINGKDMLKFIPNLFKSKGSVITGGIEAMLKNGFALNGLFSTRGLSKYVENEVWPQNTFESLGVELFIVATHLNNSQKVIFGRENSISKDKSVRYLNNSSIGDAVAASTALPPVFAPYPITTPEGSIEHFFDGEIRDTLSTHIAADHGADLVIASYSIAPYSFQKETGSLHNYGIPVILNQALYQVIQQKIERSIKNRKEIAAVYNAVNGYLRQINLEDEQREKLLSIITERTNFRPETDFIYIHPKGSDSETFFADHFSLRPQILTQIVQAGFKSALSALRKADI